MDTADFSSSDWHGVVSYRGRPVATRLTRGWMAQASGDQEIDKAVNHAISGAPDGICAADLRTKITGSLEG